MDIKLGVISSANVVKSARGGLSTKRTYIVSDSDSDDFTLPSPTATPHKRRNVDTHKSGKMAFKL